MERCFCKPSKYTIKEPKYYKTIEYVDKPGIDLSKATTHNVKFHYFTKCDEIVQYRAGYYKGIQRHYLEKHTTKKENDKNDRNCFQREDYQRQSCQCQDQGFESVCKGIDDQMWKEQDRACWFGQSQGVGR
jgi:hypothetical protein